MSLLSKSSLRTLMKERRDALFQDTPEAGEAIVPLFLTHIPLNPDSIVGAYWPIGTELDTRPLLHALVERGIACALPCMERAEMVFRTWHPSMELVQKGRLEEPPSSFPCVSPTVLLVPLLAFDRQGHRLGYGKGHYDRYLSHHQVLSIGVGFQGQEVETIPHEPHDMALEYVLTEAEIGSKKSAE